MKGETVQMTEYRCDLLVAGAGIAGMCAAVAAARKGLDVILINDRSVLGGNASSEIGIGISGSSHHGLNPAIYAKESGLVEEIRLMKLKYNETQGYGEGALSDAVFFDFIYNEKNIRLMLNVLVENCEVTDKKITKCIARHCVNNEVYSFVADNYIDSTGNGTLALTAGASFMIGREGKDEFNEYWAPEKADKCTMGNTVYFEVGTADHEIKYKPPKFAHDVTKLSFFKDINKPENFRGFSPNGPHWAYEYGGHLDILHDHNKTEDEMRKLIYGIWDYIKNSGKYPEAKNKYLKHVFAKAGTRESRRFIGDYILNENDVENKVNFEDSVAIGGWPMDIHAVKGIYDEAPASNFVPVTGTYNIPFRSMYSKDIDNLMLAGRDISVTHIALGSTRVMATCGAIGQAVGTCAYFCKKYDITPREVANSNVIKELQHELLYDDQTILHLYDSEHENFTATATSEMKYENTDFSEFIPLERDYCLALMSDTENIDSIDMEFKVLKDTVLKYKILGGVHPETYIPSEVIKEESIKLEKTENTWFTLPISSNVSADSKVYITLLKNDDIEVAVSKNRVMGAVTLRMHTPENHDKKNHDSMPLPKGLEWNYTDHQYEKTRNILFKNIIPQQHVFGAYNAVNGYARPYGHQNIWMPENTAPHTLTLTAIKPVDAKYLSVIFDDSLDVDEKITTPHKTLAKEYTIRMKDKNGEKTIEEEDNYLRAPKYKIDAEDIEKIEITIKGSYGSPAGIYGIRLFNGI